MAELTVAEYDKLCDEGFKELEELRQAGMASSKEYSELLYKLRDLTRKRIAAAGLTLTYMK